MENPSDIIVVTGGHGFIGSHVASRLHDARHFVRIVDISPTSAFGDTQICSEYLQGNLCDAPFCEQAVRGAHTVLHFAATMGGMGTIHAENDFDIYLENHTMTLEVFRACIATGVKRFFYASSACVYPETLQQNENTDVSLKEGDAWSSFPPTPQGLYGLEKLHSEILLRQSGSSIQLHIARFHNVYGPRGAWSNGREKAPAAMIRKALCAKLLLTNVEDPAIIEIWGTGTQRRSFLFIDDCVDAIIRVLDSGCTDVVNVGSEESISIGDLARLAARSVGIDMASLHLQLDPDKPVGVTFRNSNNDFVRGRLSWQPRISLEEGVRQTALWIGAELESQVTGLDDGRRMAYFRSLQESRLVHMKAERETFAILLPITSRGSDHPEDCLENLAEFAQSLEKTTWRDTHALGGRRFEIKIYLAIDADDHFLHDKNKAEVVLRANRFSNITTLICEYPRGHVCSLWRACARRAWEEGCDYLVLLGDDVVLQDEGWMRDAAAQFYKTAEAEHVPYGAGCVAFTDTSFPGMPTFPIIHRRHMDIFAGEVVPDSFVNQDGDPFIFQLYRRFGCSTMMESRIRNTLGGTGNARYVKQHNRDWTFDDLTAATRTVERHLGASARKLTIDVVVPCYRVQIQYLADILSLQPTSTCTVMFIIIVDNPDSPFITQLENSYGHRPDVRIRVNARNLGASASRNRGMSEASAEWVYFLDDDISPQPDLLVEAEKAIRANPLAAGLVGTSCFPSADTVFTTAVHLAGVTYFWDIATKLPEDVRSDLPWGVTANLIARRDFKDGVHFNLQFPKTGGGEDIDFVRQKRLHSLANGGKGFASALNAIVTHPWWNDGQRSYWRFYMWSKGDGGLIKLYPEHVYMDGAPNSAELLLISFSVSLLGAIIAVGNAETFLLFFGLEMVAAVLSANVLHDLYRHLWRNADRVRGMKSTVVGLRWIAAVIESSLIRMFSEAGRVVGLLERSEVRLLGHRFDWFTGKVGDGPAREERMNSQQRAIISIIILSALQGLKMAQ